VDPEHNLAAFAHLYNFNTCSSTSCFDAQLAPVAQQVPLTLSEIGENDCGHGFIDTDWADASRSEPRPRPPAQAPQAPARPRPRPKVQTPSPGSRPRPKPQPGPGARTHANPRAQGPDERSAVDGLVGEVAAGQRDHG
jgi:hypothetical protein